MSPADASNRGSKQPKRSKRSKRSTGWAALFFNRRRACRGAPGSLPSQTSPTSSASRVGVGVSKCGIGSCQPSKAREEASQRCQRCEEGVRRSTRTSRAHQAVGGGRGAHPSREVAVLRPSILHHAGRERLHGLRRLPQDILPRPAARDERWGHAARASRPLERVASSRWLLR